MKINLEGWSLEMDDKNYSISNIKYKNKNVINYISLDNFNENITNQEIKRLMKINHLEKMPNFMNKFEKIADIDLSTKKKIIWKMNGKAWLPTGAVSIRRSLEVTKEAILISFEFKINKSHFNLFNTKVLISDELTSIFKISKDKKVWNKEKVDSRKNFYLNNKYPLLVNTKFGTRFFINSSLKSVLKQNDKLVFIPKKETTEKEIVKSWKIRAKIYYQINFVIKVDDKKIHI